MTTKNNDRDGLTKALRAVAKDDAQMSASRQVEARLLAEVRSLAKGHRRQALPQWIAAAAALMLIVAGTLWWTRASGPASAPSIAEVKTEFLPLPYSSVPTPSVRMVRLEVPRQALASFGLAPGGVFVGAVSDSGTATVTADVLVGDDGLARAVRFVRPIGREE